MREIVEKYDALAERYSATDYADAAAYYRRRAHLVVRHGPMLSAGASVLDLACGDGGLGPPLLSLGIDYHGVDASRRMVDVARRTLGARVCQGTVEYRPEAMVDATTIFRALWVVSDRQAFFGQVRAFTRVKLMFDFDPRARSAASIYADLRAAGWEKIAVRPFLMPQSTSLPRPLQAALFALEPLPGARLLTAVRFPLLVSASA